MEDSEPATEFDGLETSAKPVPEVREATTGGDAQFDDPVEGLKFYMKERGWSPGTWCR